MEKKLYILTYDHGGYVLWNEGVKPRLKEILSWMEKYPKLKIGLDYEAFSFDEYAKNDTQAIELCKELLTKYPDRVGLGSTTYGQPLSLFISEESNVRQLTYAIRTNIKHFGKTPSVYAISEFALNNQTPQLALLCGYKAAILRSHVMGYGYPRTFDSAWGKWIGKDNSAINAVPTYDRQGRGFNCTTVDNWILSRWPHDTDISLEDFEEMFSGYSPLLASRYDDLTQKTEEITKYTETKDNYEYILLEDIPEIYGKAEDELKTTDNDFHTQMPWGYCGNEIFNGGRKAEIEVVQAEKLNAFSIFSGGAPLYDNLEKAWKSALINQHHDVMICGLLELARRFIPESLENSRIVKDNSLSSISDFFKGNDSAGELAINLHSFPVDEWINRGGKVHHIVLPPLTAQIIKPDNENYVYTWCSDSDILTTPDYVIKLTEIGIEYIDTISGERLADNTDAALFTALINDKHCYSTGEWKVECSKFGARASYCGFIGNIPFKFNMSFYGNSKRIDCDTEFEVHGERIGTNKETAGLKEALTVNGHLHTEKLCLNLNLKLKENRKMFRDLPFSISEWDGDIRKTEDYWYQKAQILYNEKVSPRESFNSTTHLEGIYWLCLRDDEKGLAILNRGCMGSAIQGNKLLLPLLYSNDYLCGTRISDGVYKDEFSLFPFNSSVSNTDIHREAMSYNYQPILTEIDNCNREKSFSLAKIDSDGGDIILTTLYPEDNKLFARFCNFSDEPATLRFNSEFAKMYQETDLLHNPLAEINENTSIFKPWEIKTINLIQTNENNSNI